MVAGYSSEVRGQSSLTVTHGALLTDCEAGSEPVNTFQERANKSFEKLRRQVCSSHKPLI